MSTLLLNILWVRPGDAASRGLPVESYGLNGYIERRACVGALGVAWAIPSKVGVHGSVELLVDSVSSVEGSQMWR